MAANGTLLGVGLAVALRDQFSGPASRINQQSQYLKQNFKALEYLYFSADDVYIINSSIYDIADEFVRLGGKVIVIDEIHKYQNWANEIKTIYDSFPELIIRFSGSSMLNILNEKFDLSRRCVISYVKPLSFREFLKLSENIDIPQLSFEEILNNHNELSSTLALENPSLYKSFLKYLHLRNLYSLVSLISHFFYFLVFLNIHKSLQMFLVVHLLHYL